MPWLFLILGATLLWLGWDAIRTLDPVRPLSKRELEVAVGGEGAKPMSDAAESWHRRRVPRHSSLERLLAAVFVVAGAVLMGAGALMLW